MVLFSLNFLMFGVLFNPQQPAC